MKILLISIFASFVMADEFKDVKKKLTPLQYKVTQEGGTEEAFSNKYWDNKEKGIYVDIVSKEPLFSSTHKYKSGSGWPSFYRPIDKKNINTESDYKMIIPRTELVSTKGKSHLGHVFNDGPDPTGLRYCVNSASLEFIPLKDLDKRGYGEYKKLFHERAIFAAGCFWGVEALLKQVDGVIDTTVGYTGGSFQKPSYEDITTGTTGHAEAIEIVYDPEKVSYEKLLEYFWRLHNPTTKDRQGFDIGSQYRSAIFYTSEKQKEMAINSKSNFDASKVFKDKAVTEVVAAVEFYSAEKYHQDYYDKNGGRVCHHLRSK